MRSRARFACLLGMLLTVPSAGASAAPGDLDPSFGRNGLAEQAFEPVSHDELAVAAGGEPVVMANTVAGATLTRLTLAGRHDRGFGEDGVVELPQGFSGLSVAVDPDGGIVTAGTDESGAIVLVRTRPDGVSDDQFGTAGLARLDLGGVHQSSSGLEIDAQGRGWLAVEIDGESRVARLDRDAELDASFGDGGLSEAFEGQARDIALGPGSTATLSIDGPAFAGGEITRVTASGDLDASFAGDGTATIVAGSGYPCGLSELAVDREGGVVVVVGCYYGHGFSGSSLFRLRPDGEVDGAFDGSRSLAPPNTNGRDLTAGELAFDSEDRILIAGGIGRQVYGPHPPPDAMVARFNADGSLDPTFGDSGISAFPDDYSTFPTSYVHNLALDATGRIVVSGGGAVARLSVERGRADADADGVSDRKDACPRRFSQRRSGCGKLDVEVEIHRFSQQRAVGELNTVRPCLKRGQAGRRGRFASLRVFAVLPGGVKRLGRAEVTGDGSWNYKLPDPGMTVFAEYRPHQRLDIGLCEGDRSRRITFRPFR